MPRKSQKPPTKAEVVRNSKIAENIQRAEIIAEEDRTAPMIVTRFAIVNVFDSMMKSSNKRGRNLDELEALMMGNKARLKRADLSELKEVYRAINARYSTEVSGALRMIEKSLGDPFFRNFMGVRGDSLDEDTQEETKDALELTPQSKDVLRALEKAAAAKFEEVNP